LEIYFVVCWNLNGKMKRINQLVLKAVSSILILLAKIYQLIISPVIPNACRYTPTCSAYFIEAIQKYGPFKGGWMGLKRIGRCHPWGGHGHDPVK
jgi:putative membrane protein insertion efficiency factor